MAGERSQITIGCRLEPMDEGDCSEKDEGGAIAPAVYRRLDFGPSGSKETNLDERAEERRRQTLFGKEIHAQKAEVFDSQAGH